MGKFLLFSLLLFSNPGFSQISLLRRPVDTRMMEKQISVREADSLMNLFISKIDGIHINVKGIDVSLESIFPFVQEFIDTAFKTYTPTIVYTFSDTSAEKIISILQEIYAYKYKRVKYTSENQIKLIRRIDSFSLSAEKIALRLESARINYLERSDSESEELYEKIDNEIELISNFHEKGLACLYMANNLKTYNLPRPAFLEYYRAQIYFSLSDKDSITQCTYQGIACESLSELFPNADSRLYGGIQKQNDYLITAYDFFAKAKDTIRANEALSKYLLNLAVLYGLDGYIIDQDRKATIRGNVYRKIFENWNRLITKGLIDWDFRWFQTLGQMLRIENKIEIAKIYLLFALAGSIQKKDYDGLFKALAEVTILYAKSGEWTLAFKYSDLLLKLSKASKNELFSKKALLNRSVLYFEKKVFKKSIGLCNIIIDSFKSERHLAPFPEIGVIDQAIELKINILKILKSDSVLFYENQLNLLRTQELANMIEILHRESEAMSQSLTYYKDWEVGSERQERLDTQNTNKILEKENTKIWKLYTRATVVLLIVILFIIFYRKYVDSVQNRLEADIAYSNVTTHDIKKFIYGFSRKIKSIQTIHTQPLLLTNKLNELDEVAEYVKGVFKTSSEKIVSLVQQIELSRKYGKVYQASSLSSNNKINIENKIIDLYINHALPIPTLLINNFIKNSIEHGFEGNFIETLEILIFGKATYKGYRIIIEDNGCGINYARSAGGTPGKGFEISEKIVRAFNKQKHGYKIHFSKKSVIDLKEIENTQGTRVIIEFIRTR